MLKKTGRIFFTLFLLGCSGNPFEPDLSGIKEDHVEILRFDRDLFGMDTSDMITADQGLHSKYGSFYHGFCESVVLGGKPMDSTLGQTLKLFISHPDMREVFSETQKIYPDLRQQEQDIASVFRHWRYYFPETRHFPAIYAMVSGLNLPMSVSDSAIGIGLDMYLGPDHRIYELAQFEKYRRRNMCAPQILPDLVRAMALTALPPPAGEVDLLSEMIYQGKVQFFIDLMAPQIPDSQKFGFSGRQINWCLENESNVWSFLVKDQLLFTTETQRIAQFMNDGPFTSGLNKASPARTGIWIGCRIVHSWIRKFGIEKLEKMLKTPARQLLNESAYKP